jgi:hypothetical protein
MEQSLIPSIGINIDGLSTCWPQFGSSRYTHREQFVPLHDE